MKILGLSIKSINASREEVDKVENIKINRTPSIKGIKKHENEFLGKDSIIKIEFEFKTSYEPKVGEITITGDILYDSENPDKIINDWEKEKKLDKDTTLDIMNFIMRECILKSANLCHEMKLPMPLKFPKFVEGNN